MTDETKKEPTAAELFKRGGFVRIHPDASVCRRRDCTVCNGTPDPTPLVESRAFIERAAKLAEAAGAVDIAGALLLLAEVVTTRAGES